MIKFCFVFMISYLLSISAAFKVVSDRYGVPNQQGGACCYSNRLDVSRSCLNALRSPQDEAREVSQNCQNLVKVAASLLVCESALVQKASAAFLDKSNKFSIDIPPSWINMPRQTPTPTMLQYRKFKSVCCHISY